MAEQQNGAQIAKAYVLVVPSLQGAQKRLTEELVPDAEKAGTTAGEKGGKKLTEGLAAAAKVGAAAVAASMAAAVKLMRESLDAYAETEQLAGGIEKIFGGDAAVKVIDNAAEAYRTAGMSANDYLKSVTGISTALLKSGVTAEEAVNLSDQALRQIADNANTFGVRTADEISQIYQALSRGSYQTLDSLSLGYAGTKSGMQELIADANKWAKANGRAADLTIDNFADVVTAIGYIQESIGIAGTTVNEAEGTISGSLSMLSGSWTNFIAGLGDPNADLDKLVDNVVSSLQAVSANVVPTAQRIGRSLVQALPGLVQQVAAMIPELLPDVLDAVVVLASSIARELPNVMESVIKVITDNADMLIGAAVDLALALVRSVPRIFEALAPLIPSIITSLTTAAIDHTEDFILAGVDIAIGIVNDIDRIISELIKAAPIIASKLSAALSDEDNQRKFERAGQELAGALLYGLMRNLPIIGDIFRPLSDQAATYASFAAATTNTSVAAQIAQDEADRAALWSTVSDTAMPGAGGVSIGTVTVQATTGSVVADIANQARRIAGAY